MSLFVFPSNCAICYGGYKVDQTTIESLTTFWHKTGTKYAYLANFQVRAKRDAEKAA